MILSLLVVAGAVNSGGGKVTLKITPDGTAERDSNGNYVLHYNVFLLPESGTEIGAAQFTLTAPEGTTFTDAEMNPVFVYDTKNGSEIGSMDGIFASSAITSEKGGGIGGSIVDAGRTFNAILAGTDQLKGRMLDHARANDKAGNPIWLYRLTVAFSPAPVAGKNYTLTVSNEKMGYSDSQNGVETTTPHNVTVDNKGYTHAGPATNVAVSGKVASYNPKNPVTIRLMQKGEEKYTTTIPAATTGSGQVKQQFSIPSVASGTYDLVVTKAAHLTYTIRNVVVGSEPLVLTAQTGKPYATITLLAGDVNGDGSITESDVSIIRYSSNINKSIEEAAHKLADINGDQSVTESDVSIVRYAIHMNKKNSDCTYDFKES